MRRSAPLKRSGFKRPTLERKPVVLSPAPAGLAERVRTGAAVLRVAVKPQMARHEGYRAIVRGFECINCQWPPRSEFAHGNLGKGGGIKADDRFAFPLCRTTFARLGCHAKHDQGGLIPKAERRELEITWAAQTRARVRNLGLWPASLPAWEGDAL